MAATRVIEIRTEIPGPRSREILERERRAVARPLIVHEPIVADRARGSTITDVDGNTFVDFVGGVGVANVGHNHPRVVEAITDQVDRFLHTDFTVVPYEGYVELAERLGALVPIGGETRGAFFNAGAEAVENAVKLARLYTKRQGVIAFEGAFHGRTWLALTMTSKTDPYKTRARALRPRGLPRAVPERVPRPGCHDRAGGARTALHDARVPGSRRGDRLRAAAGRGRLPSGAGRVRHRPAADLRRARDRPGRGRGADRVRPNGPDVRHGALRRRARPADRRQVDRRWPPALGRAGSRGDHGRPALRRDRRNLHRQSRRARGGVCGARRVRRGAARRPRSAPGRRDPRAHARLAGAVAADR